MNKKPYMCKKQIRPIAQGCVWQGCSADEPIPLSDWIDINNNEKEIKNQLKDKWTNEEMFKVTHDRMRYLDFQFRYIENLTEPLFTKEQLKQFYQELEKKSFKVELGYTETDAVRLVDIEDILINQFK